MGRNMRDSYDDERGSNARSMPPGGRGPSRPGVPNRPSMPGKGGPSSSGAGNRRPGGPGSLVRPPLSRGDSGEGSAPSRRSGPGSRAGSSPRNAPGRNGSSPSRYGDDRDSRGNGDSSGRSPVRNGYDTPPNGNAGRRRRSMADIARDASRQMSRQLGSVVARTGRALRRNERDYDSRYDSAYNSAYVSRYDSAYDSAYSDAYDDRPSPSAAARRGMPSDDLADKLDSTAYRRSRARLITRKWRMGRVRPNPLGYLLGAMLIIFLVVGVVFGGGAGGIYAYSYYSANIGKIQAVADLRNHANTTIYDRNGVPLYTAKGDDQYHIYVPLGQVSEYLRDATIDTEDRTFYTNSGVDLYGTVRAALVDARAGGAAQGASTITQQLVKLLVLKNSEKAITRKLHEAILAYGVTAQYSKDQILEMYLNQIDYGYPNQGIEAAATNYFGLQQITNPDKSVKTVTTAAQQLQLWQAAVLAGVPNGPTIFKPNVYSCDKAPCTQDHWDNPFAGNPLTSSTPCGLPYVSNFYGSATEDTWYSTHGHEWLVYCRTQVILGHMVDYGDPVKGNIYTSAQEADALVKVKAALEGQTILKGVSTSINGASSDNRAPHFVWYVVQELADEFGIDHLESAGLKIYTTLDLELQDYAQKMLHHYIDENYHEPWYGPYDFPPLKDPSNGNAHNGALVAIDQHNGDILAMVGSVDYNDTSKQVAGNVNITTSPFRSMGSTTKPLVYSTAFEMGWYPGIMLQDIPVCWPNKGATDEKTGKPIVDPAAPACAHSEAPGPYYVPHNYEDKNFSGIFPLRRQLDDSLNIAATEAMSFVGMTVDSSDAFLNMAQRLGVTTLSAKRMGPTTALGTQEIPLLQLTSAYGTFANLGTRYPQRAILEIDQQDGSVMWQAPADPYHYQAITSQAAYMVTSVLTDNFARYPFFKLNNPLHLDDHPNLEIAGKTGTSNGPNDIVTMGYTPYMTLGVWVGNSDPNDPLTPGIIGIAGAGYIFHDVMDWSVQHYKWDDNAKFPIPSGIARTSFNCLTGLAPFKDSKPADLDCKYIPFPGSASSNPYDPDRGISHRVDEDWYWQNAPPLQS